MSASYDVIVIGAGINGLTAATMLAKKGREVLVLERRDRTGGLAVGHTSANGFQAAGPLQDTTTLRPEVVDALQLKNHGLTLIPNRPSLILLQPGEAGLLLHGEPEKAAREIAVFSQKDAEAYPAYRAFIEKIAPVINGMFDELPTRPESMDARQIWLIAKQGLALRRLGKRDMLELMRISLMCAADWLNEWFETPLLKAGLAAPAIHASFTGPWSPGNTLNLLRWECAARNGVNGGSDALAGALERAARAAGLEIRLNMEVSGIRLSGGSIRGVTTSSGEELNANAVLASCTPQHTFLDLLANAHPSYRLIHAIRKFRARGTSALVSLTLDGPPRFPHRQEQNITWARTGDHIDQLERAFDAVKYRRWSHRPLLEIHALPGTNPARQRVSVLVHFVPYDLEGGWDDSRREALGDLVLKTLEKHLSVAASIKAMEVTTPRDLETRFGLSGGHLYHGEHAPDQLLVRPALDCNGFATPFKGLYLCGGGSRPGGGLTGMPGLLAVRAFLDGS